MVPMISEKEIECSIKNIERFSVPLLPKTAMTRLIDPEEKNKKIMDQRQMSMPNLREYENSIISKNQFKAKSVTFDFVEVLEFSENDDEDVPEELPETQLPETIVPVGFDKAFINKLKFEKHF